MLPILDIAPQEFGWAHWMAKQGRFVFCVQGDPRIQPVLMEGLGYIRKDVVTRKKIGITEYEVEGRVYLTPAVDLTTLARDIGVDQFEVIRLPNDKLDIIKELPGPMARRIIVWPRRDGEIGHLGQWYHEDRIGDLVLTVPR